MGTVSGATRSANTGLKGGYQNTGTSPVERPGGGGGNNKPPPVTRTVTKPDIKDKIRRTGNTIGDISYFKNLIKFNPTGIIKNVGGKILMDKILGDQSSLDTEDEYSGIKGQLAEAINFDKLGIAKDPFTPKSTMTTGSVVDSFMKENPNATKGDFVNALQSGSLGVGGSQLFDKNVDSLFEGVNLGKKRSPFDVSPTFKGTTDGTFKGNIDIDKGALEQDALDALPKEFFVGAKGGLAKFADGGRIGYKAGSVDKMRRLILKAIGAGTAGIATAKSGIFSLGKGAGKTVGKEVAQQTTSSMPPPYFFKLAEKIKNMGNDVTATTDRTIAKSLKSKDGKSEYLLEQDVSTGDTIIKKINKEGDEMITDVEIMELKKGEVVMGKNGKSVKVPDEYEEVTESNARIEGDVFNDPYYSDGIEVDEIIKEVDDKVPSIKYATGGRVPYFKGGLAALKTLMNYFAKEKGTTGSKLLSDINPKKIDSGIKNLMSKEELNQLKENRTEYVKHLLNIIKSDKKFLDNNRAIVEETIAQAPIGMEDIAKEISDSIKRNAMKENRLERLSVYNKVNPDDAIMDVEMMIKNMSTGKDKRALNATGGIARMLGE